ncbi:cyclic nucleotide-binding protein [Virgisporangium aliadipatigenens]|uniref:Cyclic nucleotide-binding protein n=1 Tax=Virgisporangium aliadipatigenens TaxID=741659 RepID=A0A8J3YW03_9ACTN|nr:Crp/Fnr family transcriptional regulator [Virgisporangium aliadipatigenens]GIJ50880.1 cyclic nucleotide-binding protein [Virgisporangium aliadipatigenens]
MFILSMSIGPVERGLPMALRFPEPGAGFWGDLNDAAREALTTAGSLRRYAAGDSIMGEGASTDNVVILWRGFVKVHSRVAVGRQVILAVRGPGDILGEMASVGGGRRCATVTAIGRATGLAVDREPFGALLMRDPHASMVVHRVLIARLLEADRIRLGSGSTSVDQRLAGLLLDFTRRFGEPTAGGGQRIGLALSQKELAACVGGSSRSVARVMGVWRQRGIVATGRQWVVVNSPTDLHRIAGQTARPR